MEMNNKELRAFLSEERAFADKWYSQAVEARIEAEEIFADVKEYLDGKEGRKREDRIGLYREAKATLEDAIKDEKFFEGVKAGIDELSERLVLRLTAVELGNVDKWIINRGKPKRKR
jgi:hypothetical protein